MDKLFEGRLPGGGYVIACGKGRKQQCASCQKTAQLECDGCDRPLCNACAVSPREGLDFCPGCFDPAWKQWLQSSKTVRTPAEMSRAERRVRFRVWARENDGELFLRLVPLGETARANAKSAGSMAAGFTPHKLWEMAGGDVGRGLEADHEKYIALMVEHGHMRPKEK